MNLLKQLKELSDCYHEELEKVPYFEQVRAHAVARLSYVNHLRCMSIIHSVMEEELRHGKTWHRIWSEEMAKQPLLRADLADLHAEKHKDIPTAVTRAHGMAEDIRELIAAESSRFPGALYVLEGTINGGPVLAEGIEESLGLREHRGLRYLLSYGEKRRERWKGFKKGLAEFAQTEGSPSQIVSGAEWAYESLKGLFECLYPFSEEETTLTAMTLNPEAGSHSIVQDPDLLAIALKAGRKTWRQFPYLAYRFGERGKRFTDSDSGWIVGLTELPASTMAKQVDWLGRVLASRGIPRYVLERHLQVSWELLSESYPERTGNFSSLRDCAAAQAKHRQAQLSDEDFRTTAKEAENRLTARDKRARGLGVILVAAAIDEASGIPKAVSNIEEWVNAARFTQELRAEFAQTSKQLKASLRPRR